MKNKKAQGSSIGRILIVLIITAVIIGLVFIKIMGLQDTAMADAFYGEEKKIGTRSVVELEEEEIYYAGFGYSFNTSYYDFDGKGSNVCDPLEAESGLSDFVVLSTIRGQDRNVIEYILPASEDTYIYGPGTTTYYEFYGEDGGGRPDRMNCPSVSDEDYTNNPKGGGEFVSIDSGEYMCVKTDRGNIVKIKWISWGIAHGKGAKIEYWFQDLNYAKATTSLRGTGVFNKYQFKTNAGEFESQNIPEDKEVTWYGYDFDSPPSVSDTTIVDLSENPEYVEMMDLWYNSDYGLFFNGKCENGFQQGMYLGSTESAFCDEVHPMLYHPVNEEVGYSPPTHDGAYYCIITNENRAVKMNWLSEPGEEGQFEWWVES